MIRFETFEQGSVRSHFFLRRLFIFMHCQGLWDKVFYNCKEWTWFSLLNMIACESWCYLGFQDNKLVGAVWFNEFSEESCYVHICSLKGYDSAKFKEQIGNLLQNVLDKSDNPCYKIRARTPRKGMARLYKNMGFELYGKEKNLYIVEKGKDK